MRPRLAASARPRLKSSSVTRRRGCRHLAADAVDQGVVVDVLVVALFGLGRRGEDRVVQLRGAHHPGRQVVTTGAPRLLVLAERAAGEVGPGHALVGHDLRFPHQDRTAVQIAGVRLEFGGEAARVGLDQVIRDDVAKPLEPEVRQLVEHLALVRNLRGKDKVVGGYAVARHQQEPVAEIVDVANLAPAGLREDLRGRSWRRECSMPLTSRRSPGTMRTGGQERESGRSLGAPPE